MTTSSSVNYQDTENDIINDTLAILKVSAKDTPTCDYDFKLVARFLNRLLKAWQAKGLQLWATTEAALFPQDDQVVYSLGSSINTPGGDHASNSYVLTTSTVAAATSATTITLATVTGMTVGDNIGIELDVGTRFWSTISAINTGTLVVTFASGITSAAASGNTVFTYTTKLNRPMDIYAMRRYINGIDTPMEKISREVYENLPNKTAEGAPLQFFYDPQLGQGKLYIWESVSTVKYVLKFTYLRPLQDFDAITDTPDLPTEWNLAVIYNLAVLVAPAFGKADKIKELLPLAQMYLKDALDWDNERVSISMVPEYRGQF